MPRATGSTGARRPAKKTTTASKAAPAKKAAAKKATSSRAATAAHRAAAKKAPAKAAAKRATAAKTQPTKAASKAPAKAAKTAKTAKTAAGRTGRKAPVLDKFVTAQRETLLTERATYLRQAESLRAEADQLAAEREPGDVQFDEESGEGDTLAVERERDLALSAQARAAVEEIDAALLRVAAGTYGVCIQCGQPIPKERLRALPYAALCVRCKSGGLRRR